MESAKKGRLDFELFNQLCETGCLGMTTEHEQRV